MRLLLAIIAAIGGIAFWRRKKIGDDAQRIGDAARNRVERYRSDDKGLADDDSDATSTDDDSDDTSGDNDSDISDKTTESG